MRILIIEDEQKMAEALKTGLKREGFAADYVTDGEAGQRRIEMSHNEYDLVVLDLMLPKRDGFEVCKNIREQEISLPILVLTAREAVDDRVKALDLGADDYLVKPFSFQEFLARVRALLRRPEQALPIELKIADLSLNTSTRKVTRNNREVVLTLKEFGLLEYLMRHPNQVLNREQIWDSLWDFADNSFSNVVDVHMKNLRKKVDSGTNKKLLETIRGVGYRIKA